MSARYALVKALLDGRVLNVKNCFKEIGLTNIAREIPRYIEQPFQVEVSRARREGKNRYGFPVTWMDYRLKNSEHNKEGIQKMKDYCEKHKSNTLPSQKETKPLLQTNKLF